MYIKIRMLKSTKFLNRIELFNYDVKNNLLVKLHKTYSLHHSIQERDLYLNTRYTI